MSNTGSPRVVSRSRFDASGEFVRYVVVPVAACFVLLDKFDEGSVGLPDIGAVHCAVAAGILVDGVGSEVRRRRSSLRLRLR